MTSSCDVYTASTYQCRILLCLHTVGIFKLNIICKHGYELYYNKWAYSRHLIYIWIILLSLYHSLESEILRVQFNNHSTRVWIKISVFPLDRIDWMPFPLCDVKYTVDIHALQQEGIIPCDTVSKIKNPVLISEWKYFNVMWQALVKKLYILVGR